VPAQVPLDIFLLWYVPAMLRLPPGLFWGGVVLVGRWPRPCPGCWRASG
jgi:hypothetical protein